MYDVKEHEEMALGYYHNLSFFRYRTYLLAVRHNKIFIFKRTKGSEN